MHSLTFPFPVSLVWVIVTWISALCFDLVQVFLHLLRTRIQFLRFWTSSYRMRYLFAELNCCLKHLHFLCQFYRCFISIYYFQVRDQDIIYGLFGISLECREIAWIWLKVWISFILGKWKHVLEEYHISQYHIWK